MSQNVNEVLVTGCDCPCQGLFLGFIQTGILISHIGQSNHFVIIHIDEINLGIYVLQCFLQITLTLFPSNTLSKSALLRVFIMKT